LDNELLAVQSRTRELDEWYAAQPDELGDVAGERRRASQRVRVASGGVRDREEIVEQRFLDMAREDHGIHVERGQHLDEIADSAEGIGWGAGIDRDVAENAELGLDREWRGAKRLSRIDRWAHQQCPGRVRR